MRVGPVHGARLEARWRQIHRTAGLLLLAGLVLAVAAVGFGAFRRAGLGTANQVATAFAVACLLFVLRAWTPKSIARSIQRSYSTDLIAATMFLVLAAVVWSWVRAGIGR